MRLEKYKELLSFFYSVLKKSSKEKLTLYKEFLKDIQVNEKYVLGVKVKDSNLKEVLKELYYAKKMKKFLKEYEPPKKIKEYINKFLTQAEKNIYSFFLPKKPKKNQLLIKKEEKRLTITVDRKLFPQDARIIPDSKDFSFELSCFFNKKEKELRIDFSCHFKVKEKFIPEMTFDNVTLFDKFAEAIGVGDFFKTVYFPASYSDGEVYYNNSCKISWFKHIKEKDLNYGK